MSSFVGYIRSLMIVDLLWSYFALLPLTKKFWFIILDGVLLALMFFIKLCLRNVTDYYCRLVAATLVALVNIRILTAGYAVSWDFYFPKI